MSTLAGVNRTELIEIGRAAGIGNLTRALSHEELCAIIEGQAPAVSDALEPKRARMQQHIKKNWLGIRSQLPGCDGKCTTFGCPDLIVQRCWQGMHRDIL